MSDVQLKIPSEALREASDTISKMSGLVPAAEGQLSTLYVLLCASAKLQKAYLEFNRNGLRVRCALGNVSVVSPVPQVMFGLELALLRSFPKTAGSVELTRSAADAFLTFKCSRSSGKAALSDPSALIAPMYNLPESMTRLPVGVIRTGLQSTLFSSQDISVQGTGPLSRIRTGKNSLEVTTYDSMSGAVHTKSGDTLLAEVPEGFDLVLPNRTLFTIFGQADVPEINVGVNERMFRFNTTNMDVLFPVSEFSSLDIASRVRSIVGSAQHGFTVDVDDIRDALAVTTGFTAVDTDIVNVIMTITGDVAVLSIKSAKVEHVCEFKVSNHLGKDFEVQCDLKRLATFLKLVRSESRITVLYNANRVVFQAPESIYVFAES